MANRPEPGLANTGDYLDGLGNRVTVYGIGNPAAKNRSGLVNTAHDKSSGHGIVRMDQKERTITAECWRLLFDAQNPKPQDQFPGWPRTIDLFDNYGRAAVAYLPEIRVTGVDNPVVQVTNEETGAVEYTVRIKGRSFRPKVFARGTHSIRVDDTQSGRSKLLKGIKPVDEGEQAALAVEL